MYCESFNVQKCIQKICIKFSWRCGRQMRLSGRKATGSKVKHYAYAHTYVTTKENSSGKYTKDSQSRRKTVDREAEKSANSHSRSRHNTSNTLLVQLKFCHQKSIWNLFLGCKRSDGKTGKPWDERRNGTINAEYRWQYRGMKGMCIWTWKELV